MCCVIHPMSHHHNYTYVRGTSVCVRGLTDLARFLIDTLGGCFREMWKRENYSQRIVKDGFEWLCMLRVQQFRSVVQTRCFYCSSVIITVAMTPLGEMSFRTKLWESQLREIFIAGITDPRVFLSSHTKLHSSPPPPITNATECFFVCNTDLRCCIDGVRSINKRWESYDVWSTHRKHTYRSIHHMIHSRMLLTAAGDCVTLAGHGSGIGFSWAFIGCGHTQPRL